MSSPEPTPTPTPTPVDPGTPPPAAPATPADPPAAGTPEHWATQVQDETLRGWAQNRGWASVNDALKAHRDLEQLRGVPADRLLTLPESADDVEGWKAVHRRLGAPESPEAYQIPKPEAESGLLDISSDFSTWAHELGLTPTQAKGLVERFNGWQGSRAEESASTTQAKVEADMIDLEKAWGDQYAANISAAKQAASRLKVSESELSALEGLVGAKRTFEIFAQIGNGMQEFSGAPGGGDTTAPFGGTPEAATEELDRLQRNKDFMDKVVSDPKGPEAQRYGSLCKVSTGGA